LGLIFKKYLTPALEKRTDGFIFGCKIIGIRGIQIMHALTEVGMGCFIPSIPPGGDVVNCIIETDS